MKLLSSFKKELILATRSFYFYIEIAFALVLLAVLLFAIPEHSQMKETRYLYLDLPQQAADFVRDSLLWEDTDGKMDKVTLEAGGQEYAAELVEKEAENIYILESEDIVRTLADTQEKVGATVSLDANNELRYKYYLQGYESERLKNLLSVLHNINEDELEQSFDSQKVHLVATGYTPLNDRENAVAPLLAFNSCLMGMFVMAAYVFLDKNEGVIKAYAVTASSVAQYLMSKILVVLLTATVSGLIVLVPVMGFKINYVLILLLLLTTSFFSSVVGLMIASFYKDITKAFGTIFFILILMMAPAISYFLPGWNPQWVQIIPSNPIIQGLKDVISAKGNMMYTLFASAGFLVAGVLLFIITDKRFRKTLNL
ncbi:MAG: ABC transporter permease [Oscillospiraceae bacterium]|jgi:ABC-2 type transport system permease protein|nr:ABC transporter permease [Oscillospiraceae bacterium]